MAKFSPQDLKKIIAEFQASAAVRHAGQEAHAEKVIAWLRQGRYDDTPCDPDGYQSVVLRMIVDMLQPLAEKKPTPWQKVMESRIGRAPPPVSAGSHLFGGDCESLLAEIEEAAKALAVWQIRRLAEREALTFDDLSRCTGRSASTLAEVLGWRQEKNNSKLRSPPVARCYLLAERTGSQCIAPDALETAAYVGYERLTRGQKPFNWAPLNGKSATRKVSGAGCVHDEFLDVVAYVAVRFARLRDPIAPAFDVFEYAKRMLWSAAILGDELSARFGSTEQIAVAYLRIKEKLQEIVGSEEA